jgi:Pyridoxamine 5'-phosphate oxidase
VTGTLPADVQRVFERFITTEYTTVDSSGQPITWPVTPYYCPGDGAIDITTGIGYPKKAKDAARNPHVSMLFSDPTGSGIEKPCAALVQGTAQVDDGNLEANRDRYMRESVAKLPATKGMQPPKAIRGMFDWYFMRIYVYVRPERVYVWDSCDFARDPQLYGSHLEEVRSHHSEEPEVPPAQAEGGSTKWGERLDELGRRHRTAVVSIVGPDGFPISCRLAIESDPAARRIRLGALPDWLLARPGRACLTAHEHHPEFRWQTNFQVRGDLVEEQGAWSLIPHKLVGGFELPQSQLENYRVNFKKMMRYRKIAKRELAKRRA